MLYSNQQILDEILLRIRNICACNLKLWLWQRSYSSKNSKCVSLSACPWKAKHRILRVIFQKRGKQFFVSILISFFLKVIRISSVREFKNKVIPTDILHYCCFFIIGRKACPKRLSKVSCQWHFRKVELDITKQTHWHWRVFLVMFYWDFLFKSCRSFAYVLWILI